MVKENATAVHIWFQLFLLTLTTSLKNFRPAKAEALLSRAINFQVPVKACSYHERDQSENSRGWLMSVFRGSEMKSDHKSLC